MFIRNYESFLVSNMFLFLNKIDDHWCTVVTVHNRAGAESFFHNRFVHNRAGAESFLQDQFVHNRAAAESFLYNRFMHNRASAESFLHNQFVHNRAGAESFWHNRFVHNGAGTQSFLHNWFVHNRAGAESWRVQSIRCSVILVHNRSVPDRSCLIDTLQNRAMLDRYHPQIRYTRTHARTWWACTYVASVRGCVRGLLASLACLS